MTFGPFSVLHPLPDDHAEPVDLDPDYVRDCHADDFD